MAHYRIYGPMAWVSQSGNAAVSITNTSSSKLLIIKSFEVRPNAVKLPAVTLGQRVQLNLDRVTSLDPSAFNLPVTKHDTSSANLPSGLIVGHSSSYTSSATLRTVQVFKQLTFSTMSNLFRHSNFGRYGYLNPNQLEGTTEAPDLERIQIADGTQFAVTVPDAHRGIPLFVEVVFLYNGATYTTQHFVQVCTPNVTAWHIINNNGSSLPVQIVRIRISEVGDISTPFFQLVPFLPSTERFGDSFFTPNIFKYDTSSPDFTYGNISMDVAGRPAGGIPQVALSEASVGAPAGLNYLHTRDFNGPVYFVYFPEHDVYGVELTTDHRGFLFSRKRTKISDELAPITLRPGETVALVSSAELATGATAVALAGFSPFDFGCDIDVQDFIQITLTGLQNPSEVRVYAAGTTTEIAGAEDITEGTFTATIDVGTYPNIDISILSLGYQNLRYLNLAVGSGLTIPVVQQIDRQYQT